MKKSIRKDDVEALTKILSQHRPNLSLELGTGTGKSTEILARYSNRVISLEQNPAFIELARRKILPELQEKIEFRLSEVAVYPVTKYLHGLGYKELPLQNFDFVLIDGPGEYHEGEWRLNSRIATYSG
jgi:predicted O-methyltransferase YrrM